jgi:lysophospholipase L1-like esterase
LERQLSPDFPGLRVVNAGVRGNTTRDILLRLNRDVIQKKPNLVIVMIGINDASYYDPGPHGLGPIWRDAPRVPLKEFRQNMLDIVVQIKQSGASILLVTPNPLSRAFVYSNLGYYRDHDMNESLRKYAAIVASIGASSHIPVVDLFQIWSSTNDVNKYLTDGMHPNAEGHAQIADLLAGRCRMLLTRKQPRKVGKLLS